MRRALLLVSGVVALAGCVSDNRPDDATCGAPAIELAVVLTADALTGDELSVCRDQEITLAVEPEVSGVLHIHGYDSQVPATNVVAGESVELVFVAARSGQFPIEFHALEDPRGVELGIFTVHEP